jgi:DNA-binding MarR family transcriptional regulator
MSRSPNVDATDEFTRHSSLGYQVNHLARLLEAALHQRISPLGVVPGQFAQILALYEKDGLTQRQLCDLVRIEQPTMAKTLQRMERDHLIRREPDPGDRRRTRVLLTAHARALRGDLVNAATEVNAAATKDLSDREVSEFMHTLARIIDNLETAGEQPRRNPDRPVTPPQLLPDPQTSTELRSSQ